MLPLLALTVSRQPPDSDSRSVERVLVGMFLNKSLLSRQAKKSNREILSEHCLSAQRELRSARFDRGAQGTE
jgi:hypothetical protein